MTSKDTSKIEIENGWYIYIPAFLSQSKSEDCYNELNQLPFIQSTIKIFGKEVLIPRKECLLSNDSISYTYSGNQLYAFKIPAILNPILKEIENLSKSTFNAILVNLYESGQHSNGWHADNEKELGINPIIASLSFGAKRRFDLKHNHTNEKISFDLGNGDLLIMGGEMQHYWKHQIAKTKRVIEPRINLTMRLIKN